MSDNKVVKTVTDSAVIIGIAAGVGYLGKKVLKENFLNDPSSDLMIYVKWTAVLAGSIAAKQYLEDKKVLPNGI